ncbi:hypothetical protein ANO11243_050330 [Dothideomycetidae sp. 11243]|nr:hypothetical protein ANO11243_050330 [fungal sp. No.11243]
MQFPKTIVLLVAALGALAVAVPVPVADKPDIATTPTRPGDDTAASVDALEVK